MEGSNVDSVYKEENPQTILKKNERESKSLRHLLILGDPGGCVGHSSEENFVILVRALAK